MKTRILNSAGLLLLAIIFSTGLIFAFIELPKLLDNYLENRVGFPQFDQGLGDMNALKTEMFIQGLHLRWIGYGSLALILFLIILGYASRRSGWALAGAAGLFIPVFGQFAFSMFFLAGLGFLRVEWLPFLEINSFDVLGLGKVIYVPYWVLMWIFSLFGWHPNNFLSYLFMGSGALLFTWGVLVWFQSRYSAEKMATSRIYRISRHPQYLGWIIWSYGFMLFTPFEKSMKISWTVSSSLPWLLMTMTIVGICMMEELKMMKITEGAYQEYRARSPFLILMPKWLNRILTAPARLVTREAFPTRPGQVVWITLLYTGILIALSLFWVDFGRHKPGPAGQGSAPVELAEAMVSLDSIGEDRKGVWTLIRDFDSYGQAGMDSLLVLAEHSNPVIREFSIQLLGDSEDQRAESLYIENMYHPVKRVRMASIIAAGKIRSERAADSLISMLAHLPLENNLYHIYGALSEIGDPRAIPFIAASLEGGEFWEQISALNAIMKIDPSTGITYAIKELGDENVDVRRNAVMVCILSGDPAVIRPLEDVLNDEDFEVRFYARQGLKKLEKE
jgi:protein-S-isoprenylcysteine O-methyltransferase Ste14